MTAEEMLAALETCDSQAVRLAELASVAVEIEPALLRRLRRALVPEATPLAEAVLWSSDVASARTPASLLIRDDVLGILRKRLREDQNCLDDARAVVLEVHRGISELLRCEEDLVYLGLVDLVRKPRVHLNQKELDELIQTRIEQVLRSISDDVERRDSLLAWSARALPTLPIAVQTHESALALAALVSSGGKPLAGAWKTAFPPSERDVGIGVRWMLEDIRLAVDADNPSFRVPPIAPYIVQVEIEVDGRWGAATRVGVSRANPAVLRVGGRVGGVRLRSVRGEGVVLRREMRSGPWSGESGGSPPPGSTSRERSSGAATIDQAIRAIKSGDPEQASHAVAFFDGANVPREELVDISGTPVTLDAARKVLAFDRAASAELILQRIKACGVTGETWHQAQRAAALTSPPLRPAMEGEIIKLIESGAEVSRHAITALGELGVAMLYRSQIEAAVSPAYRDKRLTYAIDAAVRSFELADDRHAMQSSAALLLALEQIDAGHWAIYRTPVLETRHVDVMTTVLLTSQAPRMRSVVTSWLGTIGASRAAPAIISAMRDGDEQFRLTAATAIWRLGDPDTIARLRREYPEAVALNGLAFGLALIQERSEFDQLFRHVPTTMRYLALRAIGLAGRRDYVPILREELKSGEPMTRGCAALALARLGEDRDLARCYTEASDARERTFFALALLAAHRATFEEVEDRLRSDLADKANAYFGELQTDILSVLLGIQDKRARSLALAWAPFFSAMARRALGTNFK